MRRIHSVTERLDRGRGERKKLSRADHRELKLEKRGFDPIEVLREAGAGRLKNLLPIKYDRMSADPFAFFRGSVSIMAADLGRLPHTGIHVHLCGDAHVQNLGSYSAPNGELLFDFNDFDETIKGPFEWDLKRMATSIVLAGKQASHKEPACEEAAEIFAATYCETMTELGKLPILQAARHQISRTRVSKPVQAAIHQSMRSTPADLVKKYTEQPRNQERRFKNGRPLFWRVNRQEAERVLAALKLYRESLRPENRHIFDLFKPVDVGFKVVGTGSVGMRDYIVLLEGNGSKDALFLQVKQEMPSAYARYLPKIMFEHEGHRVVDGQRAIQPLSDLLLGYTSLDGHDFLVRQLNDHKGGIDLNQLRGTGLVSLAEIAGELLARGHARSGDALAIHGYCGNGGKMVKAIRDFASAYAALTEKDYEKFLAWRPK